MLGWVLQQVLQVLALVFSPEGEKFAVLILAKAREKAIFQEGVACFPVRILWASCQWAEHCFEETCSVRPCWNLQQGG